MATFAAKPTINLTQQSDTGISDTDNVTRDLTPTLNGTAARHAIVTILDDGVEIGTVLANTQGRWGFTVDGLDEGKHFLTAVVETGGQRQVSDALLLLADHTAPAKASIDLAAKSDHGRSSTDNRTNDSTPTLTGTAEKHATVTIRDGHHLLGTVTASAAGEWHFTTNALSEGKHRLTATATDIAGNHGKASLPLHLIIDTTAPVSPTIALGPGWDSGSSSTDHLTQYAAPVLVGTAEAGATIVITDGDTVLGKVRADKSGDWTFNSPTLADGAHTLTAHETDVAGNKAASVGTLDVTIDTETAKPTLSLVNDDGTAGDNLTTDPTLSGTAEAGAVVSIFVDGLLDTDGTATADQNGHWTFTPVSLTDGKHTITATVTDAAGNVSSVSKALDIELSSREIFTFDNLPPDQGYVIQATGDNAVGRSVHTAGDVNGDGFADMIIGAPGFNGAPGETYVVFGNASGLVTDIYDRQALVLFNLTASQGFIIEGGPDNESVGFSVSSAGDVNGDGIDDVIVGSKAGDDAIPGAGDAYVIFGSKSGFGTTDSSGHQVVDLAALPASQGFIIEGDTHNGHAGWSVHSTGDVNGDGFDDVIVGAPYSGDGGQYSGQAYVVFGSASGFGTTVDGHQTLSLATLTASQGFIIQGDAAFDYTGWSVSSAGDINGDGFSDLVVGAYGSDHGHNNAGAAYVVFGSASSFGTAVDHGGTNRQVIDLTSLSAQQGFIIQGAATDDAAGFSVSEVGDVNGDGFDDLIIGSPKSATVGRESGEAYVVFGHASGFGTADGNGHNVLDLASLSASEGFVIKADAEYNELGRNVSSAGDINGDGFDDIVIGSALRHAYVVFGSAAGFGTAVDNGHGVSRQVLDLASLTPDKGFVLQGTDPFNVSGPVVSSAGDVNGDGFDDLIIGDGSYDQGRGQAYILYGSAFGTLSTTITLTGTASAETLVGGNNDDTLSGGGGADVLIGGAGDDRLSIGDGTFARIRGGHGIDTLAFSGAGMNVDFTAIKDIRVRGIEHLDLTGTGDNTATLSAADVFHFSAVKDPHFTAATLENALVVLGDSGDMLNLEDTSLGTTGTWTLAHSDVGLDGSASGAYDIYEYKVSGTLRGFVAVDADVTVHTI